jgi:hypothetical protein
VAPARDEIVCALGAINRENAELYGHLTARRVRVAPSLGDLLSTTPPAVLLATWEQLRVADLELLHDFSVRNAPIGLLVGNSQEDLRRRVVVSGAQAVGSGAAEGLPPLPSGAVIGRGAQDVAAALFDRISDSDASPEVVRSILRGPSSVLGFLGHSDGVDARLSNRATLCARVESGTVDLHLRPANCDTTGYCHRRHIARVDALASGALLSPSVIAARVVLMMSCYVVNPIDCSVHPAHGLMAQLMQNAAVGAVVAPWEVAFPYLEELLEFAEPLLRGHSIGEALAGFYRSSLGTRRACNRYLLFGDPAIRAVSPGVAARLDDARRLAPTSAAVAVPAALLEREAAGEGRRARAAPAAWLEARLERIAREPLRTSSSGELRVGAGVLARARCAMQEMARAGSSRDSYEALLAAVLAFEGSMFVHWFEEALGLPEFVDRETHCFGCGARGRLFRLESRFSVRWFACCTPCASFYADTPEGSDLIDARFEVRPDNAVHHSLPAPWDGPILMNLRSSLETRLTWPIDRPFDVSALPPGRSWLWLHTLSDEGMFSFSRMIDNRPVKTGS